MAVENSFNHIILTDISGRIFFANRTAQEVTGYSLSEMIGQTPRLWGGLMDETFYRKLWYTIKVEKQPFKGTIRNRNKNGDIYIAVAKISPIFNKTKNLIGFMGTEEDITENFYLEKKLAEDKAKSEAILNCIGNGLIFFDEVGKIVLVNSEVSRLLGYTEKELIGSHMVDLIGISDVRGKPISSSTRPLKVTLSIKLKSSGRYQYTKKDGNKIPVELTISPVLVDGKLIGAVEVFRDNTKDLEISRAKDEFVAIASHELRTPLTAIDGLVSMILDNEYGMVNENLREPLENISTSSERLIHLVNNMLNISRINAGRLKYTLSDIVLVDLINKVVETLHVIAKQKNITISVAQITETKVQADADKVNEILMNLMGNALKFTDTGSISITTREVSDRVNIYVSDTGIGISKENLPKLFGIFKQLDSGIGRPAGSGLGLHLSREMARRMGGDICVQASEPGKGSIFVFSVPKSGSALAKKVKEDIDEESKENPDQKAD